MTFELLNPRKFYTRLLRGSLHTRVQGLWGHDDLQGAPLVAFKLSNWCSMWRRCCGDVLDFQDLLVLAMCASMFSIVDYMGW